MSEIIVGQCDLDYQMMKHREGLKDHSLREMYMKLGVALMSKFPPKKEYVYYPKIDDGSYSPYIITENKLSLNECKIEGVYLRDIKYSIELKVERYDC